jgi:hypothetical protein
MTGRNYGATSSSDVGPIAEMMSAAAEKTRDLGEVSIAMPMPRAYLALYGLPMHPVPVPVAAPDLRDARGAEASAVVAQPTALNEVRPAHTHL